MSHMARMIARTISDIYAACCLRMPKHPKPAPPDQFVERVDGLRRMRQSVVRAARLRSSRGASSLFNADGLSFQLLA
jgi:hypothetical protein